jgi:hypothetical protein
METRLPKETLRRIVKALRKEGLPISIEKAKRWRWTHMHAYTDLDVYDGHLGMISITSLQVPHPVPPRPPAGFNPQGAVPPWAQ